MSKINSSGFAFGKAMTIIQAIAELGAAFSKAEEVAEASGDSWAIQEITEGGHDALLSLGVVLHKELSTIYEEERV